MIKMAFPTREVSNLPVYCVCHNEPKFIYYKCPNCYTPQCEISASCKVCKVMLVSAVHLSRTTQTTATVLQYTKLIDYLKKTENEEEEMKMEYDSQAQNSGVRNDLNME